MFTPRGGLARRADPEREGRTVLGVTRRRLMSSGVAAGATLLAAACGPFGGQPPAARTAAAGKLEAWNLYLANLPAWPGWDKYLNLFSQTLRAKHPQLEVTFQPVQNALVREKLVAGFASGTPPDVLDIFHPNTREFIDRGFLLDITKSVARLPEVALTQYLPPLRSMVEKEGKLYGLPWVLDLGVFMFNAASR